MSAAFFFVAAAFILLSISSRGLCSEIVTSNDEIPASLNGIVSFSENNLVIASYPINLQLKTLNPGSIKFSMSAPRTCSERTITLYYGSSKCEIALAASDITFMINRATTVPKLAQMKFSLTTEGFFVNDQACPCSSMNAELYKVSITGACRTPITFDATALVISDPTTSTSTTTTSETTSTSTTTLPSTLASTNPTQTSSDTPDISTITVSSRPIIVGATKSTQSPIYRTTAMIAVAEAASNLWYWIGGFVGGLLLLLIIAGLVGYFCIWKKRPGKKNDIPGDTTFDLEDGSRMQRGNRGPNSIAGTTGGTVDASSLAGPSSIVGYHLPPMLLVLLPYFGKSMLPSGYKEAAEKVMFRVIGEVKFKNEVRQNDFFFGKEYTDITALDAALLEECQFVYTAFVKARFEYLHKNITNDAINALVETFVTPAEIQRTRIAVHHSQYGYEAIAESAEQIPLAPPGVLPSSNNAQLQQHPQPPPPETPPTVAATTTTATAKTAKTAKPTSEPPSKKKDAKRKYFASNETKTITTTRTTTKL